MNENLKKNWKGKKKNFNLNWSVNQIKRKIDFTLPHKDSLLVFGNPDLNCILDFPAYHILDNTVSTSIFPTDILKNDSIMDYTDIVEYSVIRDTIVPILRSFPFEQRLSHDRISITKTLNNALFDNLQYWRLLKNSIHSMMIELRSQTGELIPFVSVGVTRLTLIFRKREAPFSWEWVHEMVVYNSSPRFSGVPRQRGRGFGAFAGIVARTAFPILK